MKKENSFSTNLLLLLRKQKITQKKFAQMLNTKESVVSHWLTGKTLPSAQSVLKITEILNVPTGYFFDEENKVVNNENTDNKNDDLILKMLERQNKLMEKSNAFFEEKIKSLEEKIKNLENKFKTLEKKK